jgi:hypothetical protein
MDQFKLPEGRTLLSGKTVADIIERCNADNIRKLSAALNDTGVLGAIPAPNFAPAPPVSAETFTSKTFLLHTWASFRAGSTLRVLAAVRGSATLTASLVRPGEIPLPESLDTQEVVVSTGGAWGPAVFRFTLPRRIDFEHDGAMEVRLQASSSISHLGIQAQPVAGCMEGGFLETPEGIVYVVERGGGLTPGYRALQIEHTSGLAPISGNGLAVWAALASTEAVERAVRKGWGTPSPTISKRPAWARSLQGLLFRPRTTYLSTS